MLWGLARAEVPQLAFGCLMAHEQSNGAPPGVQVGRGIRQRAAHDEDVASEAGPVPFGPINRAGQWIGADLEIGKNGRGFGCLHAVW